ncbi:DUF3243 domain-containing protein [Metabacillus fastidiosus]|uniref:DUF3243 domain-containing protein n=1 Tax=Metabacillus fastidiosus TaxID=1458 RepID=A0ABU6P015_9BACI|nr:DUF3243 domain-containing protein [Metabacillus fastidiosus]MED4402717.1 DUF3243 domain-containing protein [Metabacillus fastidiosus]MED4461144.1 DUF3243 domain-containing protein [Metabacillus fastidiosus]MED4534134.1 DUF3243 domain-containing protein [Metabacillus fastidiosus]
MLGDKQSVKVEEKLTEMSQEKKEEILENFNHFANYLGDKVRMAKNIGMSDEAIAKSAEKVANYLAEHQEPKNREEQLLQELWKNGEQEEQHALAHMLVRMVQNRN